MKTTVTSIADQIPTEADAWEFLENLRWPNGPICPNCHETDVYLVVPKNGVSRRTSSGSMSQRRTWNCRPCRRQFSATTGTIMHGTKVPLRTWVLVIFEMVSSKNGVAGREIERKYGLCSRTAWFVMHRIREAMRADGMDGSMRGVIVADETWIGGAPQNRYGYNKPERRDAIKVLPGEHSSRTQKTPVLSLINATTGEARSRVVPNVQAHTLRKVMAEQIDMGASDLMTDEGRQYLPIGREFRSHEAVNHSQGEYGRGRVTTNRAEGYFAQLKRSLDGTHHHVSVEHLPRYLAEFDFRYSTCKATDAERMARLVEHAEGRRLTYKRVKATH